MKRRVLDYAARPRHCNTVGSPRGWAQLGIALLVFGPAFAAYWHLTNRDDVAAPVFGGLFGGFGIAALTYARWSRRN